MFQFSNENNSTFNWIKKKNEEQFLTAQQGLLIELMSLFEVEHQTAAGRLDSWQNNFNPKTASVRPKQFIKNVP